MISSEEILRAFRGSWRLVRGDAGGMTDFDCSVTGFWRSFGVIGLTLPVPIVELVAQQRLPPTGLGDVVPAGALYWISGFAAFLLVWTVFPAVLAGLARPLGISARYVPYVVTRNWSTLLAVAPSFLATLAFDLGVLPLSALGPANLFGFVFNLFCSWRVARIACRAPAGLAAGLVGFDTVLSMVIYEVADRLVGM